MTSGTDSVFPSHLTFIPGLLHALLEYPEDFVSQCCRAARTDENGEQVRELV